MLRCNPPPCKISVERREPINDANQSTLLIHTVINNKKRSYCHIRIFGALILLYIPDTLLLWWGYNETTTVV